MNLHAIISSELELLLQFCIAQFPPYWDWRINNGILQYETSRSPADGMSHWYALQLYEMNDFTNQARDWAAQGRPPLR